MRREDIDKLDDDRKRLMYYYAEWNEATGLHRGYVVSGPS